MEIETVTIKSENTDDVYYQEDLQIGAKELPQIVNSEKPFRCGVCGHCTTSNVLLKVHMRMHLLKRMHQCRICKKSFNFVIDYNNHMSQHVQERAYQCLLRESIEDEVPKAVTPTEPDKPTKQFRNKSPNLPLDETEKFLLVQYIEKLGLNTKYKELENIKGLLRSGWSKMVELFAENDFDRNPDKLARTYFHMKNQAKMHMERFYIQKKLPRPRKIDYMFVKLCPGEFEGLRLDLNELQEDSQIYSNDTLIKEDPIYLEDEEKHIDDVGFLPNESVDGSEHILSNSEPSTSCKRSHSEEDTEDAPPNKIHRSEYDDECINSLKLKFLVAEDKRREKEHELELKRKDLEIRYREELHKKDIEIKNLEIVMLTQKLQQNRNQPRI